MGKQNGARMGTVSENRENSYNGIPRVPLGNFLLILFHDKMVRKPFCRRINILHRLRRKKQYYTAFLGGHAAMPLISGIIKRSIRFIRNKYKSQFIALLERMNNEY